MILNTDQVATEVNNIPREITNPVKVTSPYLSRPIVNRLVMLAIIPNIRTIIAMTFRVFSVIVETPIAFFLIGGKYLQISLYSSSVTFRATFFVMM